MGFKCVAIVSYNNKNCVFFGISLKASDLLADSKLSLIPITGLSGTSWCSITDVQIRLCIVLAVIHMSFCIGRYFNGQDKRKISLMTVKYFHLCLRNLLNSVNAGQGSIDFADKRHISCFINSDRSYWASYFPNQIRYFVAFSAILSHCWHFILSEIIGLHFNHAKICRTDNSRFCPFIFVKGIDFTMVFECSDYPNLTDAFINPFMI